jgi:predicted membrane-bound dolichyl-phosphate-mannose-protein mannosyltransferase
LEVIKKLSAPALPFITAGLRPELFTNTRTGSLSRALLIIGLAVLTVIGFGFRVNGLSTEGLSEDELNKLNAVSDYRAHGLTSANGEHPFLMKAALLISVTAADKWNETSLVAGHPELNVPVETSLRLPGALFGALSAVLIFLVASELFGLEVGLIAAALWAFDPIAIGFSRIAKEDTFLIFFFLLANVFWLRGQRIAESQPQRRPEPFYWATAAALGAMFASKYVPPVMLVIIVAYNYAFQRIPVTRWVIGKKRFLKFFLVMGIVFLICNPTILLPGTWKAMSNFTSGRTMGHDSYEFLGRLYPHRFQDWLKGEPWYFYLTLLVTKLPLVTLLGFVGGLGLLFRRKLGDGRYFLLIWLVLWAVAFMLPGGKFTRYITSVLPAIVVTAAIGVQFVARRLGRLIARMAGNPGTGIYARAALASLVIISSFWSAVRATPHYRLYMNALGGSARAGLFFPQDEFYDAYMRDVMSEIAKSAPPATRVASELPTVAAYYAQRANRPDLICVEMSDPVELARLAPGDFMIDARGRTYLSNQAMLARLRQAGRPAFNIAVGTIPAADVFVLTQESLAALRGER